MIGKVLLFLALVALSESMFRPPRPPRYNECSCEEHEEVPCDEGEEPTPPHNQETTSTKLATTSTSTTVPPTTSSTTTVTPSTTTVTSTTVTTTKVPITPRPCRMYLGAVAYKRESGWWCSQGFYLDVRSDTPMTMSEALRYCEINEYPSISSFETDKERSDYAAIIPEYKVDAYWVNISLNKTSGLYYWGDGSAIPTINPQPTVIDPNGYGVFTLSRDPSTPGRGTLSIVPPTGEATPSVRGVICGGPGES